jgi:hypothetical protein
VKGFTDLIDYKQRSVQNLLICKTNYPKAEFQQIFCSFCIPAWTITFLMYITINFHYQPCFNAYEVGYIFINNMLAPEFKAIHLPVAQVGPELFFSRSGHSAIELGERVYIPVGVGIRKPVPLSLGFKLFFHLTNYPIG